MRTGFALFVLLQFVNAATIAIEQSGLSKAAGADVSTTAGRKIAQSSQGFAQLDLTGGLSDLFGAITAGLQAIQGLFASLFAAPELLIQLGVPIWVASFLFAPLAVVIGRDLIYFATNR